MAGLSWEWQGRSRPNAWIASIGRATRFGELEWLIECTPIGTFRVSRVCGQFCIPMNCCNTLNKAKVFAAKFDSELEKREGRNASPNPA